MKITFVGVLLILATVVLAVLAIRLVISERGSQSGNATPNP